MLFLCLDPEVVLPTHIFLDNYQWQQESDEKTKRILDFLKKHQRQIFDEDDFPTTTPKSNNDNNFAASRGKLI